MQKNGGIFQVASMLMFTMTLSRLFGFVRDVIIVSYYGQNFQTDAYNAAFTIPDFLYYVLVGGALSSAFIPVFSGYLANKQEEDGWQVASTVLNVVLITATIAITLGLIFTPQLVGLVSRFTGETLALTILLTRVMFAQCFFMCLNGIAQGILHSYKQFTASAVGSVLYNVAIVVVGILLSEKLGILGFSIGVVVGAFLNFLVQIPTLWRIGLRYRPVLNFSHPGVKKFFRLLGPVFLGLSVTHLNVFISVYLGSGLGEGILTSLNSAQRIMQMPIGIFAVAIALAVFPTMTTHAARGEMDAYKKDLSMGLRTIVFITLPAAVGLIVLRVPLVRAMYLQAQFTSDNLDTMSTALFFYSLGLVGYSAGQLLNRGFYATQDTKSPVTISIATIALNIALSFILVIPLGYKGLPLAYSISGLVSMLLLLYYLRRKIGKIGGKKILQSIFQSMFAALIMGGVVSLTVQGLEQYWDMSHKLAQIALVLLGTLLGIVTYGTITLLMKMEEIKMVLDLLKKKLTSR